jgi:hypothetical protein
VLYHGGSRRAARKPDSEEEEEEEVEEVEEEVAPRRLTRSSARQPQAATPKKAPEKKPSSPAKKAATPASAAASASAKKKKDKKKAKAAPSDDDGDDDDGDDDDDDESPAEGTPSKGVRTLSVNVWLSRCDTTGVAACRCGGLVTAFRRPFGRSRSTAAGRGPRTRRLLFERVWMRTRQTKLRTARAGATTGARSAMTRVFNTALTHHARRST